MGKSTDGYDAPEEVDFEPPVNPPDPGDEEGFLAAAEQEKTDPRSCLLLFQ